MRTRFFACTIASLLLFAPGSGRAQSTSRPLPTIKDGQLQLAGPVVFSPGTDKLAAQSDDVLLAVKDYLADKAAITLLRIEGHTDSNGAQEHNQALSERRALAVGRWLVDHGVDCHRLVAVGFGETKPIADPSTPEGKAQNRRMAFVNVALRGRLIGGQPADGGGKVAGDLCASASSSTSH